jgi:hypothetical protein
LSQPYLRVIMTRTPDYLYEVDNHSSLATIRMIPPNPKVPDFHSREVGVVVGPFTG